MDLQRVDIDLTAFPEARCNDGSAGVFYFRPGVTQQGRRRWIIQLEGGGGCRTPDACAQRWCSVGTNFGARQMTSALAPMPGIVGSGILYRGPMFASPFEDANQVFIDYCSSDTWSGREGPIELAATDPITGAAITYSIDFHGADILDAVIATLRQDGVAGPIYTLDDDETPLADLDGASHVVLAGASAGGSGVINNGDRIGAVLATNDLDGLLDYRLLIDSTFGPEANDLEWSTSVPCANFGLCTFEDIFAATNTMFVRHGDDSCETWHAANDPATAWRCDDTDHVSRHHLMTPMMMRMGLQDSLLSENLIDDQASSGGMLMTLALFAQLVHDQLLALPDIAIAGLTEETAAVAPALYGPNCAKHETLSSNVATFNVRIGKGGVPYHMFDVWANWTAGAAGSQIVYDPGDQQDCN